MVSMSPETKHGRAGGRPPFECIALLLQGGGALGAYQAGVYEALAEHHLEPDWVAGISIGAINAAIIAGNAPEVRVARLREFWSGITEPLPGEEMVALAANPFVKNLFAGDWGRSVLDNASAMAALIGGVAGFFKPRLPPPQLQPWGTIGATSYYDTHPLLATIEKLVDFERINRGRVRLSVGAVNVRNGNFVYFDSTTRQIGPPMSWQAAHCRRDFRPSRSKASTIGTAGSSRTRLCNGFCNSGRGRTPSPSRWISGAHAATFHAT